MKNIASLDGELCWSTQSIGTGSVYLIFYYCIYADRQSFPNNAFGYTHDCHTYLFPTNALFKTNNTPSSQGWFGATPGVGGVGGAGGGLGGLT